MKIKANVALIVISIVAGILLIFTFALFIKKDEVVTLPIKVVEYADFECSACGYLHPMVKKAIAQFSSDNVTYEFKHFPLSSIHPDAYLASLASEAARDQGKFNEYSEILFEENIRYNSSDNAENFLTKEKLIYYAKSLKLNADRFIEYMDSPDAKARVDNDIAEANGLNLNGTPSFFINGKQFNIQNVSGSLIADQIEQAIVQQFVDYINSKLELAKSQSGAWEN